MGSTYISLNINENSVLRTAMQGYAGSHGVLIIQLLGHLIVKLIPFEVFTALTMKNAVFWNVASCRYCINRG
jgi:hypothetical protein